MSGMENLEVSVKAGLESQALEILRKLVGEMPPCTASLHVSSVPGQPSLPYSYFEMVPNSPSAGRISGVVKKDEIELTVGLGGMRSLFRKGNTIFEDMTCEQEFREICMAVVHKGFIEQIVRDRHGKFIYAEAMVEVRGKIVKFGSGRWLPVPFSRWKRESKTYSPYY